MKAIMNRPWLVKGSQTAEVIFIGKVSIVTKITVIIPKYRYIGQFIFYVYYQ